MVKDFAKYIGQVLKQTFTGAFLVVDLLGVILLVLSLKQPKVPIVVSIVIFATIFIVSTFLVWRDVANQNKTLRAKIAKLKDAIPNYQITTGAFEKFSITEIIEKATAELNEIRGKIAPRSNTTAVTSPAYLASAFSAFRQAAASLPALTGSETLEDQAERLTKHLEKLEAYNTKLKHTYKVPLVFEATRSDGNVELKVQASPACTLIVEDNYVNKHLPETHKPTPLGSYGLMPFHHIPSTSQVNKLYPYSYAENGIAYSKLIKINASRKYNLFDEDFYVETDSESVELTITVHSEKINQPQIISVNLDLRDVTPYEIKQRKASR